MLYHEGEGHQPWFLREEMPIRREEAYPDKAAKKGKRKEKLQFI